MVSGGDVLKVSLSNPVAGTLILAVPSGETSTYELGGVEIDDDPVPDGLGRLVAVNKVKAGKLSTTIANDMNSRNEYEFVKACQASLQDTTITFTHINGSDYQGKGAVKASELDAQKSTFTLDCYSGIGFVKQ